MSRSIVQICRCCSTFQRNLISDSSPPESDRVQTAIIMLNMGGPRVSADSKDFLQHLFTDPDIFRLPFQRVTGKIFGSLRAKNLERKYDLIGGGSPIHEHTKMQGIGISMMLDKISPSTAPHKAYTGFRYVSPFAEESFDAASLVADRIILFSQYPQYSCTTSGSSFKSLYRHIKRVDPEMRKKIVLIDRWGNHESFISALVETVNEGLSHFKEPENVHILFTAHSVPLSVISRGDRYMLEVFCTVNMIVEKMKFQNPYTLVWQSKVGPARWVEPSIENVISRMAKNDPNTNVLIVPVTFTSDHVETLYDLDIELKKLAEKHNLKNLKRAPSLNDRPSAIKALSDVVNDAIKSYRFCSSQFFLRCHHCKDKECKEMRQFYSKYC